VIIKNIFLFRIARSVSKNANDTNGQIYNMYVPLSREEEFLQASLYSDDPSIGIKKFP
jgi:hypothetical protein